MDAKAILAAFFVSLIMVTEFVACQWHDSDNMKEAAFRGVSADARFCILYPRNEDCIYGQKVSTK